MKLKLKETVAKLLNAVKTDYIVEEGTSGMWFYRKWNSGVSECWGTTTVTLTHYTTWNGGYGYSTSVTFPSGLFTSEPNPTYSAYIGSGFVLTGTITGALTKDGMLVFAWSSASGSKSTTWYIKAIGKWK